MQVGAGTVKAGADMANLTQLERVRKASESFQGVCQTDFLLPDVVDGGAPITRVGARLWDLEDKHGFAFEHIGWRNKTKIFRLISEPEVERNASERRSASFEGSGPAPAGTHQAGADVPLSLFGITRAKGTHGWVDQEDCAA